MRKFYTWVYDFNPNDNNSRYTPGASIFSKYPHLEGLVTLEEFAVPEDRIKDFAPGNKWGYRLGYFEADEAALANFGTSVADILAKAKLVYSYHELKDLTDAEALAWVKRWSDLAEESPGKFLVSPEGTNPFTGEPVPARYLSI